MACFRENLQTVIVFCIIWQTVSRSVENTGASCTSKTCTEDNQHRFEVGRQYTYQYAVESTTELSGVNEDRSTTFQLTAEVNVQAISKCHLTLSLSSVTVSSHDQNIPSDRLASLRSQLTLHPIEVNWQDGTVSHICSNDEEPIWVLNIKKGIVSSMQNTVKDNIHTVDEIDILGECKTSYRSEQTGFGTIVSKYKDLTTCKNGHSFLESSILFTEYSANSARKSLLDSTQACTQTWSEDKTLQRSKCKEKHLFRPFSYQGNGAVTTVSQSLELITTIRHIHSRDSRFSPSKISSLAFVKETPRLAESTNSDALVSNLQNVCNLLSSSASYETIPNAYMQVVKQMKLVDLDSLENVWEAIESSRLCQSERTSVRKIFLNALPMCVSTACMEFAIKLMERSSEIKEELSEEWLNAFAMIPNPTEKMISILSDLTKSPKLAKEASLTVGTMIYRYCQKSINCLKSSEVVNALQKFQEDFGTNCHTTNENQNEKILISLHGLGNAGITTSTSVLNSCVLEKRNSDELRVAAIHAFRRMDCRSDKSALKSIFADVVEDSELRIAAYISLMKCPTFDLVSYIVHVLQNEEVDQVGSFVWSHLMEVKSSSDPLKVYVRNLLSNHQLSNKFNKDKRKYSSYYEGSLYSETLNLGAEIDGSLVWSTKSFVPRSAHVNLTVDLFGSAVNLIEIGGRIEGVEGVLQDYFGETAQNNEFLSTLLNVNSRPKRGVGKPMKEIKSGYPHVAKNNNPIGSAYIRTFGNEIDFFKFDSKETAKDSWMTTAGVIYNLFTGNDFSFQHHRVLLDSNLIIPTGAGIPLSLAVTSASSMDFTFGGQLDIASYLLAPNGHIAVDGHFQPRAAVEVSTTMDVALHDFIKSGIELESKLTTGMELKGHVGMGNGQEFDIRIDVPQDTVEVFSYKSKFFTDNGYNTQPLETSLTAQNGCTENTVDTLGIKVCYSAQSHSVSSSADDSTPFLMSVAPMEYSVNVHKTDSGLTHYLMTGSYQLQLPEDEESKIPEAMAVSFYAGTPESNIDRSITAEINFEKTENDARLYLSVLDKSVLLYGSLVNEESIKDVIMEITVNDKDKYSLKGHMSDSQTERDATTWSNYLQIQTPYLSPTIQFNATYAPKRKLEFNAAVTDIMNEQITLQGNLEKILSSSNNARYSGNFDFVIPGYLNTNAEIRSSGRGGKEQTKTSLKYNIFDKAEQSMMLHYKYRKFNARRNSERWQLSNIFTSSQFPSVNHKVMIQHYAKPASVESSLTLDYGSSYNKVSNENKLTMKQYYKNLTTEAKTHFDGGISLILPYYNVDYEVKLLHIIDWQIHGAKNLESSVLFNPDKENSMTFKIKAMDSSTESEMSVQGDLMMSTPWGDAVSRHRIWQPSPKHYSYLSSNGLGRLSDLKIQLKTDFVNQENNKSISLHLYRPEDVLSKTSDFNNLLLPSASAKDIFLVSTELNILENSIVNKNIKSKAVIDSIWNERSIFEVNILQAHEENSNVEIKKSLEILMQHPLKGFKITNEMASYNDNSENSLTKTHKASTEIVYNSNTMEARSIKIEGDCSFITPLHVGILHGDTRFTSTLHVSHNEPQIQGYIPRNADILAEINLTPESENGYQLSQHLTSTINVDIPSLLSNAFVANYDFSLGFNSFTNMMYKSALNSGKVIFSSSGFIQDSWSMSNNLLLTVASNDIISYSFEYVAMQNLKQTFLASWMHDFRPYPYSVFSLMGNKNIKFQSNYTKELNNENLIFHASDSTGPKYKEAKLSFALDHHKNAITVRFDNDNLFTTPLVLNNVKLISQCKSEDNVRIGSFQVFSQNKSLFLIKTTSTKPTWYSFNAKIQLIHEINSLAAFGISKDIRFDLFLFWDNLLTYKLNLGFENESEKKVLNLTLAFFKMPPNILEFTVKLDESKNQVSALNVVVGRDSSELYIRNGNSLFQTVVSYSEKFGIDATHNIQYLQDVYQIPVSIKATIQFLNDQTTSNAQSYSILSDFLFGVSKLQVNIHALGNPMIDSSATIAINMHHNIETLTKLSIPLSSQFNGTMENASHAAEIKISFTENGNRQKLLLTLQFENIEEDVKVGVQMRQHFKTLTQKLKLPRTIGATFDGHAKLWSGLSGKLNMDIDGVTRTADLNLGYHFIRERDVHDIGFGYRYRDSEQDGVNNYIPPFYVQLSLGFNRNKLLMYDVSALDFSFRTEVSLNDTNAVYDLSHNSEKLKSFGLPYSVKSNTHWIYGQDFKYGFNIDWSCEKEHISFSSIASLIFNGTSLNSINCKTSISNHISLLKEYLPSNFVCTTILTAISNENYNVEITTNVNNIVPIKFIGSLVLQTGASNFNTALTLQSSGTEVLIDDFPTKLLIEAKSGQVLFHSKIILKKEDEQPSHVILDIDYNKSTNKISTSLDVINRFSILLEKGVPGRVTHALDIGYIWNEERLINVESTLETSKGVQIEIQGEFSITDNKIEILTNLAHNLEIIALPKNFLIKNMLRYGPDRIENEFEIVNQGIPQTMQTNFYFMNMDSKVSKSSSISISCAHQFPAVLEIIGIPHNFEITFDYQMEKNNLRIFAALPISSLEYSAKLTTNNIIKLDLSTQIDFNEHFYVNHKVKHNQLINFIGEESALTLNINQNKIEFIHKNQESSKIFKLRKYVELNETTQRFSFEVQQEFVSMLPSDVNLSMTIDTTLPLPNLKTKFSLSLNNNTPATFDALIMFPDNLLNDKFSMEFFVENLKSIYVKNPIDVTGIKISFAPTDDSLYGFGVYDFTVTNKDSVPTAIKLFFTKIATGYKFVVSQNFPQLYMLGIPEEASIQVLSQITNNELIYDFKTCLDFACLKFTAKHIQKNIFKIQMEQEILYLKKFGIPTSAMASLNLDYDVISAEKYIRFSFLHDIEIIKFLPMKTTVEFEFQTSDGLISSFGAIHGDEDSLMDFKFSLKKGKKNSLNITANVMVPYIECNINYDLVFFYHKRYLQSSLVVDYRNRQMVKLFLGIENNLTLSIEHQFKNLGLSNIIELNICETNPETVEKVKGLLKIGNEQITVVLGAKRNTILYFSWQHNFAVLEEFLLKFYELNITGHSVTNGYELKITCNKNNEIRNLNLVVQDFFNKETERQETIFTLSQNLWQEDGHTNYGKWTIFYNETKSGNDDKIYTAGTIVQFHSNTVQLSVMTNNPSKSNFALQTYVDASVIMPDYLDSEHHLHTSVEFNSRVENHQFNLNSWYKKGELKYNVNFSVTVKSNVQEFDLQTKLDHDIRNLFEYLQKSNSMKINVKLPQDDKMKVTYSVNSGSKVLQGNLNTLFSRRNRSFSINTKHTNNGLIPLNEFKKFELNFITKFFLNNFVLEFNTSMLENTFFSFKNLFKFYSNKFVFNTDLKHGNMDYLGVPTHVKLDIECRKKGSNRNTFSFETIFGRKIEKLDLIFKESSTGKNLLLSRTYSEKNSLKNSYDMLHARGSLKLHKINQGYSVVVDYTADNEDPLEISLEYSMPNMNENSKQLTASVSSNVNAIQDFTGIESAELHFNYSKIENIHEFTISGVVNENAFAFKNAITKIDASSIEISVTSNHQELFSSISNMNLKLKYSVTEQVYQFETIIICGKSSSKLDVKVNTAQLIPNVHLQAGFKRNTSKFNISFHNDKATYELLKLTTLLNHNIDALLYIPQHMEDRFVFEINDDNTFKVSLDLTHDKDVQYITLSYSKFLSSGGFTNHTWSLIQNVYGLNEEMGIPKMISFIIAEKLKSEMNKNTFEATFYTCKHQETPSKLLGIMYNLEIGKMAPVKVFKFEIVDISKLLSNDILPNQFIINMHSIKENLEQKYYAKIIIGQINTSTLINIDSHKVMISVDHSSSVLQGNANLNGYLNNGVFTLNFNQSVDLPQNYLNDITANLAFTKMENSVELNIQFKEFKYKLTLTSSDFERTGKEVLCEITHNMEQLLLIGIPTNVALSTTHVKDDIHILYKIKATAGLSVMEVIVSGDIEEDSTYHLDAKVNHNLLEIPIPHSISLLNEISTDNGIFKISTDLLLNNKNIFSTSLINSITHTQINQQRNEFSFTMKHSLFTGNEFILSVLPSKVELVGYLSYLDYLKGSLSVDVNVNESPLVQLNFQTVRGLSGKLKYGNYIFDLLKSKDDLSDARIYIASPFTETPILTELKINNDGSLNISMQYNYQTVTLLIQQTGNANSYSGQLKYTNQGEWILIDLKDLTYNIISITNGNFASEFIISHNIDALTTFGIPKKRTWEAEVFVVPHEQQYKVNAKYAFSKNNILFLKKNIHLSTSGVKTSLYTELYRTDEVGKRIKSTQIVGNLSISHKCIENEWDYSIIFDAKTNHEQKLGFWIGITKDNSKNDVYGGGMYENIPAIEGLFSGRRSNNIHMELDYNKIPQRWRVLPSSLSNKLIFNAISGKSKIMTSIELTSHNDKVALLQTLKMSIVHNIRCLEDVGITQNGTIWLSLKSHESTTSQDQTMITGSVILRHNQENNPQITSARIAYDGSGTLQLNGKHDLKLVLKHSELLLEVIGIPKNIEISFASDVDTDVTTAFMITILGEEVFSQSNQIFYVKETVNKVEFKLNQNLFESLYIQNGFLTISSNGDGIEESFKGIASINDEIPTSITVTLRQLQEDNISIDGTLVLGLLQNKFPDIESVYVKFNKLHRSKHVAYGLGVGINMDPKILANFDVSWEDSNYVFASSELRQPFTDVVNSHMKFGVIVDNRIMNDVDLTLTYDSDNFDNQKYFKVQIGHQLETTLCKTVLLLKTTGKENENIYLAFNINDISASRGTGYGMELIVKFPQVNLSTHLISKFHCQPLKQHFELRLQHTIAEGDLLLWKINITKDLIGKEFQFLISTPITDQVGIVFLQPNQYSNRIEVSLSNIVSLKASMSTEFKDDNNVLSVGGGYTSKKNSNEWQTSMELSQSPKKISAKIFNTDIGSRTSKLLHTSVGIEDDWFQFKWSEDENLLNGVPIKIKVLDQLLSQYVTKLFQNTKDFNKRLSTSSLELEYLDTMEESVRSFISRQSMLIATWPAVASQVSVTFVNVKTYLDSIIQNFKLPVEDLRTIYYDTFLSQLKEDVNLAVTKYSRSEDQTKLQWQFYNILAEMINHKLDETELMFYNWMLHILPSSIGLLDVTEDYLLLKFPLFTTVSISETFPTISNIKDWISGSAVTKFIKSTLNFGNYPSYFRAIAYWNEENGFLRFPGMASVINGKQVITFDGQIHNLQGLGCVHVLAHDFENNNFTLLMERDVEDQLIHSLNVKNKDGSFLNIEINRNLRVKYNETNIEMPFEVPDYVTIKRTMTGVDVEIPEYGILFICQNHITSNIQCHFKLAQYYHGQVAGVMGTMDGEDSNDFVHADGSINEGEIKDITSWSVSTDKECNPILSTVEESQQFPSACICDDFFTSADSSLVSCFEVVDPKPYLKNCKLNSCNNKTACDLVHSYRKLCFEKGAKTENPGQCLFCNTQQSNILRSSEIIPQQQDVVLVVEVGSCNNNVYAAGRKILAELDRKFLTEQNSLTRYGLVTYGRSEPIINTMAGGEIFGSLEDLSSTLDAIIDRNNNLEDNIERFNFGLQATRLAALYPFAGSAKKSIIMLSCENCKETEEVKMVDVANILDNLNVELHLMKHQHFSVKQANRLREVVIGFDSVGVYTRKSVRGMQTKPSSNKKIQVQYPKQDSCSTTILLSSGGSSWNIEAVNSRSRSTAVGSLNAITNRILGERSPAEAMTMCQNCRCLPSYNKEFAREVCTPC